MSLENDSGWNKKDAQKQPFADVFQKRCSKKFRDIHWKISVLESVFDKVADLKLYEKDIPTQEFSYEYYKFFKKVLYETLPVATFGYSNQSRIFQQITTLKFQGQHASQSNFCRHEGLCPAAKTEVRRCWFQWNFEKIQITFSEKETEEENYAQWLL